MFFSGGASGHGGGFWHISRWVKCFFFVFIILLIRSLLWFWVLLVLKACDLWISGVFLRILSSFLADKFSLGFEVPYTGSCRLHWRENITNRSQQSARLWSYGIWHLLKAFLCVAPSVADLDPGSGVFFRIRDPDSESGMHKKISIRIWDEHPRSFARRLRNSFLG